MTVTRGMGCARREDHNHVLCLIKARKTESFNLTPSVPEYVMLVTFCVRQDFESPSQLIGASDTKPFGLWDPCLLRDW